MLDGDLPEGNPGGQGLVLLPLQDDVLGQLVHPPGGVHTEHLR